MHCIFIDGSLDLLSVSAGCGFFIPVIGLRYGERLRDLSSSMTAELYGLLYGLEHFMEKERRDVNIFSDSRAALTCTRDRRSDPDGHSFARFVGDQAALVVCRGFSVRFA